MEIEKIVAALEKGKLVCLPTDTLFALSCDATNATAINKLYRVKCRSKDKKLPVFFADFKHVEQHCELPERATQLASKFWPGKLTMILKLREISSIARDACDDATSSIAVRVPNCNELLKIIKLLQKPIIGTSANISGHANLHSFDEVEKQFRGSEVVLFKCGTIGGMQSTIITFEGNDVTIVREGAIEKNEIS